jgi:hypothetical protein
MSVNQGALPASPLRAAVEFSRRSWHNIATALALPVVFVLWAVSLQSVDLRAMNDYGLTSVLPAGYFIALGLLTLSACLQLRTGSPGWVWFLHVAMLVLLIHGTPSLLYESLRYSWAWKHVGVIDYLQRHAALDPASRFLSVYHNYPGFFTFNLFLTQAAGLSNPLGYAALAPAFFNLIYIGPLWMIYRAFTDDQRLVRLSLWVFFCASWVGQDYFAPQAISMFLYLLMIALLLWYLRDDQFFGHIPFSSWPVIKRVTKLVDKVFGPIQQMTWVQPGQYSPAGVKIMTLKQREAAWFRSSRSQQAGAVLFILLVIAAIVVSHPLTPVFILLSLFVLAALRQTRMRWLLVAAGLIIIAWNMTGARNFAGDAIADVLTDFGNVKGKMDASSLGTLGAGQQFAALMSRALTGLALLLGMAGIVRRRWARQSDVAAIGLALSPLVMPVLNSYGGEMIFRAFLFSLPFMAFFIAGLFFANARSLRSWAGVIMPAAVSAVLLACLMFAYYGKERQYAFTKGEWDAASFVYETAPEGTLLIEGSRNYPSQFRNYERFVFVPISRESVEARREIMEHPDKVLERWMSNPRYSAAYAIFTRSQRIMDESLGYLPVGAAEKIEQQLQASGKFKIVYQNRDARVYVLAARQRGGNNP